MVDDEYFGRIEDKPIEHEPTEPEPESPESTGSATLTLAEIEKRTGISYVTLIRYAQQYRDRLPSDGEGNKRRYYPAAIEEFQKIKAEIAARRTGGQGTTPGSAAKSSASVSKSPRRGRKKSKSRAKPAATVPPKIKRTVEQAADKPAVISKIQTGASPNPAPDLDRMARVYQLRIQRKALDGVLAFVTDWRTRINAEIEELEK